MTCPEFSGCRVCVIRSPTDIQQWIVLILWS